MIIVKFSLIGLGLTGLSLYAKTLSEKDINDGPYIFFDKKNNIENSNVFQLQAEALSICDGQVFNLFFSLKIGNQIDFCGESFEFSYAKPKSDPIDIRGDFQIAALSDIHGQFDLFIQLLKNNQIIDSQRRWNFGDGHLVITGDVFDRGDQVTEALWYLYDLEKQAERSGGKLHLLLGNHEVMVLNGDLRYLNKKYQVSSQLFAQSFEKLYSQNTILGEWLRQKNVLVKINQFLFAHGGFHPDLARQKFSLEKINQLFKQSLVAQELKTKRSELEYYLHKTNGPIWYRGYFNENGASEDEINLLLNHFKVTNIIVGHTSYPTIETRFDGKIIAIDSSMKKGKYAEILLYKENKLFRGTLSGKILALE